MSRKRNHGETFSVHICDFTNDSISAARAGMFGGATVVGVLFLTSGIPRIQADVLSVRV